MNIKLIIVGAIAILALAVGSGFSAGTWKANSEHAETVREMDRQISDLKESIAEQNKAVAVAEAQAKAAEQAKAQAEKHATDMASFSKARLSKLEQALKDATSCDEVLQTFWELRR